MCLPGLAAVALQGEEVEGGSPSPSSEQNGENVEKFLKQRRRRPRLCTFLHYATGGMDRLTAILRNSVTRGDHVVRAAGPVSPRGAPPGQYGAGGGGT